MKVIKIYKLTKEELEKLNVNDWPVWECGVSKFNWKYEENESCYILEGEVIVETENAEKYEIKEGDFVVFPKGLKCVWDVKKPVRKRYSFNV